jgi:hypothetical protein
MSPFERKKLRWDVGAYKDADTRVNEAVEAPNPQMR